MKLQFLALIEKRVVKVVGNSSEQIRLQVVVALLQAEEEEHQVV